MIPKFIITKRGVNALAKNIDPNQVILSSLYNTLKYFKAGTKSITGSTSQVVTINHGLGYVPFFIVYVNDVYNDPTKYAAAPYNIPALPGGKASVYADKQNLYLKVDLDALSPSYTFNFYYKIFKNNLKL